jgi:hypothetical protein
VFADFRASKFRFRSFAFEVSLSKFRFRSFAFEVSLSKFRFRSFAVRSFAVRSFVRFRALAIALEKRKMQRSAGFEIALYFALETPRERRVDV